jgi:hypothetical protein
MVFNVREGARDLIQVNRLVYAGGSHNVFYADESFGLWQSYQQPNKLF